MLSGGTSKGGGDLSYRVLARRSPGIVVHGVALKPGKPICLGAAGSTPVAILPGFPTSAIFTFQEFVAPVLLQMAGLGPKPTARSRLALRRARFAAGSHGRAGVGTRTLWVGSQGGLDAAARGECDLAGVHLLDPQSDTYNTPFLPPGVRLFPGYCRMQGLVHRPDDPLFAGRTPAEAVDRAVERASCLMVNRNRRSGTRCLLDGLLAGRRSPGFAVEVRSHNAVAAAVSQGRADWGVAIEPVARAYGLAFLPLRAERYDFAVPADRWDRPAVSAFRWLWDEAETRCRLAEIGFLTDEEEDRP